MKENVEVQSLEFFILVQKVKNTVTLLSSFITSVYKCLLDDILNKIKRIFRVIVKNIIKHCILAPITDLRYNIVPNNISILFVSG